MKTLYLECGMGAAGDMLTAALLELLPDKEKFLSELNHAGIPGVTVSGDVSFKCGIKGTHITVRINGDEESEEMHTHTHGHDHNHEHEQEPSHKRMREQECLQGSEKPHHHSSMDEIRHMIEELSVSEKVKADVLAVYSLIAEAESYTHGVPVTDIHFHEVGTMDAVTDVLAVCMLMDRLSPDQVVVSPVHVGSGYVRCAHGILPVPAPATAYILRGVPVYGGEIKSELCTPTGAALLKHFASKFGDMPLMSTTSIGYGMGKKDFPVANCVRALLGETKGTQDTVVELSCNLDDMTAEAIGFAEGQFFAAGALDVYTIPIQMKKSRPGILLSVMCREKDSEQMIRLIFRHTTTLGVRENISRRYTLSRTVETIATDWGNVRKKVSSGYGVTKEKYEYEDIARIAKEQNISLSDVTTYLQTQRKS